MDQDKVNPFSENPDISVGNTPVSQSSPAGVTQPGLVNTTSSANIYSPAAQPGPTSISNSAAQPSPARIPVNPYAPAGAPYAPGSNTPPPDYAMPITNSPISGFSGSALGEDNAPAVPNTAPHFSAPDSAYTSISPAPSQGQDIFLPSDSPEKPKFFTKKFIIIASISLVLIAAAIVVGVIMQNNKKSGENNKNDKIMVNMPEKEAATRILNLYITGEDKTESPDFSRQQQYGSLSYESNLDNNEETALGLLIERYAPNIKDGHIASILSAYVDYLLIEHYQDKIAKIYSETGFSEAQKYIDSIIKTDDSTDNISLFRREIKVTLQYYAEALKAYKENNCQGGSNLDSICEPASNQYIIYYGALNDLNSQTVSITDLLYKKLREYYGDLA